MWWGLFGMVIGAGVAGSWWMQPCFELLHWVYLLENGQNQKTASSQPTEVVDLGRDEAINTKNDILSLGLDLVMVQWRQDGVERGSSSAVVLPLNAISDRGSKKGESRDSVMSKIALTKKIKTCTPQQTFFMNAPGTMQ